MRFLLKFFGAFAIGLWFVHFPVLHAQDLELGDPIQLTEEQIEALTVDPASKSAPPATADGDVSGFTVDVSNRSDVLALYHEIYVASENYAATHGWTGNVSTCNAGTTSQDLKDDTRRRVNYFRAMAGLSSTITFNASKNAKAQKAALIMSKQGALSHFPNDDFPGNPCLSADGHEAAGKSNLSLGRYGPAAVQGQLIDDGSNNAVAGHRRWILYSRAVEMGTGDLPSSAPSFLAANSLWTVGDFGPAPGTPPEVAWPPAGFVPYHLAPNDEQDFPRWSFSYPGAGFSGATVTMKMGATNVPVVKETVVNGFGDNTVVWRPSGIPATAPSADTTYTVTITGITGAPFSQKIYDVTLIDPFNLNDEVTVTGSTMPSVGSANSYTFNAIAGADGYDALIGTYTASTWTEGAETAPVPQVIDNTDASYSHISTHTKASGSRAFHLATPDFSLLDNIEIDRDVIPEAGSQISFKYRRLFMHPDTKLRVQVSGDGGQSFKTIHTISGNNSNGDSGQWDPAIFLSESVPVPVEYHNRLARFRFLIETTGNTYLDSDDNNGIYLDDITLSNSLELTGSTVTQLGAAATSFDYTPATVGEMRVLMVNPELGGRSWGYGPALKVTAAVGGPPLLTKTPVDNATGIAIGTNLTMVFGETVQKGASGTITVHRSADDSVVGSIAVAAAGVVVAGDTVTVDLPFDLDYETGVYVLVSAGMFENAAMAGSAGITSPTEWSFTTELDPLPDFRRWIDQFPGLDPGGLTLEQLEMLDQDLDGITLLEEFGFDGDPETADAADVSPILVTVGGIQELRFFRATNKLVYVIQTSTTLEEPSWTTRVTDPGVVGTLVSVPLDPAWSVDGRVFVRIVLSRVAGP